MAGITSRFAAPLLASVVGDYDAFPPYLLFQQLAQQSLGTRLSPTL
jgi:hypothetical protein